MKIENKLKKNVSFFSIENVKIEYVQNLINDQILRSFEFCFRENFKNSYLIVAEIIENLRFIDDNLNHYFNVINQFRDLKIRKKLTSVSGLFWSAKTLHSIDHNCRIRLYSNSQMIRYRRKTFSKNLKFESNKSKMMFANFLILTNRKFSFHRFFKKSTSHVY